VAALFGGVHSIDSLRAALTTEARA
jgi:hypothetical protein